MLSIRRAEAGSRRRVPLADRFARFSSPKLALVDAVGESAKAVGHATLARMIGSSSSPRILVQRLHAAAQMPRYAHTGEFGDLAADVFAAEAAVLAPVGEPGSTVAVRTGLALELPSTHGALVEDRSGLAIRGLTTLAGVIDPGYRGELKIVLTNLTAEPQTVAPGHRIAQLRVVERIQASFEETDDLAEAPRGKGGFGSTGV